MKKKQSPIRTLRHSNINNGSGYSPVDTKVLVLPDYIDEASEGGIVLTSSTVDQNELAITEGVAVSFGLEAFMDNDGKHLDPLIVEGVRVVWAMYAGQMLEGNDGRMYRLINDSDVVAVEDAL